MSESSQSKILDARLREVWRRDQTLHRSTGFLTFCRWVLLLFLFGVAVDWLFDLPAAGRVVILVALLIVAICKGWQYGWRHLRKYDASHTALQVEKNHGGMESLLVTAVQFGNSGSSSNGSGTLREKTCHLAGEAAGSLRAEDAVSFKGFRRFVLLALIPVLVIGGLAIYNGPFMAAGFGRIFTPWLAIQYPTRTLIWID
ncbi:hypothetical protein N9Z74_00500, partial [bacterium]|nr:hypothetical protein [bacterium]